MQRLAWIALGFSLTFGCGGGNAADGDADGDTPGDTDSTDADDGPGPDGPLDPPARGFQVETPDNDDRLTIQPGQEITLCYYFKTPNTEPMAIKRFASQMTAGSHHMILFRTRAEQQPAGTITAQGCGGVGGGSTDFPQWTYSVQNEVGDLAFPTDDGTGKPLAIEIPPNTPMFMQMHYVNASDDPIHPKVTLNAEALDAGAVFTPTAAYVTFHGDISIPDGSTGHVETGRCAMSPNARFWLMSTHAHKQATHTEVKDGTSMMFQSDNWEHPGTKAWMTPAEFYSLAGNLSYSCTYDNNTGRTIETGDSAQTDEMCMASGYYFMAGGAAAVPRICYQVSDNGGNGLTYPAW